MVQGVLELRRQLNRARVNAEREVRAAVERSATEIVAGMNALRPIPEIEAKWRWGAAPRGSLSVASADAGGLTVTIYATARTSEFPQGFPDVARWFEFGTGPRVQRTTGRYTGFIPAQPYFWPVFRSHRRRVRDRLRRAVNRAFAQASSGK
jgi:hypothetical protein